MKISLNWLRELVELPTGTGLDAIVGALTDQGLEVEGIEHKGRDLVGLVVAEVLEVKPHPNADKLRIVRVRAGAREENVVCGAPNVPPPGYRVCWAPPGARLPGDRVLEGREIRGVFSPGMLCSEPEMGLGEDGHGILVLPPSVATGIDVAEAIGAKDDILEVNVTPNRPDALSHVGVARELAARFASPLRSPTFDAVPEAGNGPTMDVRIDDDVACPRYSASFVTGLKVGPSPIAMRLRLQYCGVRAISNLVDVTNYVLLETGHPLHAFDFDRLCGGIVVRRAKPGEGMVTLDGQPRVLTADDVVITDQSGPVALAGVMGGSSSEVSDSTRTVLLEAATFEPRSIRRTSRRLGLISEASYRFERGVDPNGIPHAARRAVTLLAQLGGGTVVKAAVDRYPRPPAPVKVALPIARLNRVAGRDYSAEFARSQLERLGFACEGTADGLLATVPSYRPDVTIAEDLIEEILRMGEYSRPVQTERVRANATTASDPELHADRARRLLAGAGLHEIVSWAFVPRVALEIVSCGKSPALAQGILVKNPISADYEAMRTTLLVGLTDAFKRNAARGTGDVALFEVGPTIARAAKAQEAPLEQTKVAGLIAGRRSGWLKPGEAVDLFDLKHVVEELLDGFGVSDALYEAPAEVPYLHPGVSARVRTAHGITLGNLGELHPEVRQKLGIDAVAFYFEIDLAALAGHEVRIRTVSPPRFPSVERDVSFWIDANVPAAAQRSALLSAGESLLQELAVREDFRDPKYAPAGKKGMLWTMVYRAPDRTLTVAEADEAHARVVKALASQCDVQIR